MHSDMMFWRWFAPSALLALMVASAGAQTPIDTRNQRAVALPFLRLPFDPQIRAEGQKEWSVGLSIANEMRRRGALEDDHETTRLMYRHTRGTQWGEWWVEGGVVTRGGGFLDPIIDGWHKNVLGWSDPVRNSTRMGRTVVRDGGRYSFGSASGISDITVGVGKQLSRQISARAAIKLPTGSASNLIGSGGLDAGVSVYATQPINRRLSVVAQAGLVVQGHATRLPNARKWVDQEGLALVLAPNRRDEWIVQWQSERAPITGSESSVNGAHRLMTFGYRRKLGHNEWLEASFSEDEDLVNRRQPMIASSGPDFSVSFRWVKRF